MPISSGLDAGEARRAMGADNFSTSHFSGVAIRAIGGRNDIGAGAIAVEIFGDQGARSGGFGARVEGGLGGMKNIYDGVVSLDTNGEAVVEMPEWFETLNRDFRYLLTALGAPMPGSLHCRRDRYNRFKISGGMSGMKVSWQVTGIRQDAWANKNRIKVEEEKSEKERGHYLHPEALGKDEERGVEWAHQPDEMRQMKQRRLEAEQTRQPRK